MKDVIDKRLMIFGVITVAFLIPISIAYYLHRDGNLLIVMMLTPAVSAVITRAVTKEGTAELYLKPHFKGNLKWYLSAYLLTPFAAYAGAAIYFAVFRNYDPLASSYAIGRGFVTLNQYYKNLVPLIPLVILLNPAAGLVQCFGEEFAWRGYLLPKLCKKMAGWKAVLLTGAIWGLWHSPIIAMGYNYGPGHPVAGILAMIAFTTVLGTISAFLFFKTKSVWVSVVFHAAINSLDMLSPSEFFMRKQDANAFVGPDLLGIVGGMGLIVLAAICFILIYKNSRSHRPGVPYKPDGRYSKNSMNFCPSAER